MDSVKQEEMSATEIRKSITQLLKEATERQLRLIWIAAREIVRRK